MGSFSLSSAYMTFEKQLLSSDVMVEADCLGNGRLWIRSGNS